MDSMASGRLQSVPRTTGWVLPMLYFLAFTFIGAGNVDISYMNNFHIMLVELVLFFAAMQYLSEPRFRNLLLTAFLFALLVLFLNYLSSMQGGKSDWIRTATVMVHILFFASSVACVWHFPKVIDGFAMGLMFAAIISVVWGLCWWFSVEDPLAYNWAKGLPNFNNIRHLGYLLVPAALLTVYSFLTTKGNIPRVILFSLMVVFFSSLIWSGGRGAYVSFIAGLLLMAGFVSIASRWRKWGLVAVGMLLAFFLSQQFIPKGTAYGLANAVERSVTVDSVDGLTSRRLVMWQQILKDVEVRPWIGWGGEGYVTRIESVARMRVSQTHNGFLQIAVEWGVPFAFVFFAAQAALFFAGLFLAVKHRGKEPRTLVLGLVLVSSLGVLSLVDGVYYHGLPFSTLAFSFAFLLAGMMKIKGAVEQKGLFERVDCPS